MRRSILLGATLAAVAVFATPNASQAQFGFRIGNVGIGVGTPYYGGYGYGYGRGYGAPYYGGYRYGSPYYSGYRYGWSPGYSNWYSPSSYYYSSPSYSYSTSPSYSYYSTIPSTTTTQSFYQGGQAIDSAASENAAHVRVSVPANARLWFQDQETSQRGSERVFYSPPLTPGKEFIYTLKASWTNENGQEVTRSRQVRVHAGDFVNVDLRAGQDSTSAYPPSDQARPAPADSTNPNAGYRGPRDVTPLTPGSPPPVPAQENRTQPATPPAVVPGTTNNTTIIGGGIAPNLGPATNVPAGTTPTPRINQPAGGPAINPATPGTTQQPAGGPAINPVTPGTTQQPAGGPAANIGTGTTTTTTPGTTAPATGTTPR